MFEDVAEPSRRRHLPFDMTALQLNHFQCKPTYELKPAPVMNELTTSETTCRAKPDISPPGCATSLLPPATPISCVDKNNKNWLPLIEKLFLD